MGKYAILLFAALGAAFSLRAETYANAAGAMLLPQGGSHLRRVGGASVGGGLYLDDYWAIEGDVAWLEDAAGLGARALCHASRWGWYDRMFGFSAFDPFVTAGVRGWLEKARGQIGPDVGLGAFYHLGENWSLRAQGAMTLGLESRVETLFTLAVGVQYAF